MTRKFFMLVFMIMFICTLPCLLRSAEVDPNTEELVLSVRIPKQYSDDTVDALVYYWNYTYNCEKDSNTDECNENKTEFVERMLYMYVESTANFRIVEEAKEKAEKDAKIVKIKKDK